jgi:hypothetical protein
MAQRNRGSGQESSVGAQGKVQGRHPYFDLDSHLRPLHGTENPPRQCRKVVAGCGIGKKLEVEPLYKSGSVAELVQPAAQFNALSDTVPGLKTAGNPVWGSSEEHIEWCGMPRSTYCRMKRIGRFGVLPSWTGLIGQGAPERNSSCRGASSGSTFFRNDSSRQPCSGEALK